MELDYVPKTLTEAHEYLDQYLQDKDQFKSFPEENVLAVAHMWLGRWLRNKWHLWWNTELYERVKSQTPEGEPIDYPAEMPELVKWFKEIGIEHADDMSGIIIISYHKKLNNLVYDLEEDVKHIQAFYAKETEDQIIESNKNEQE